MLSVIIITLNEENTIPNLLNDLKQQTVNEFEIIIVDSNSDDNTVKVAQKYASNFEQFKIIKNEQRGASLGRNTGAQTAKYERLLFLDADTRLNTDFIKQAIDIVDTQKLDVAGVYCDMSEGTPANRSTLALVNAGLWFTKWVFPTIVGACILSTKTAHNAVGGFDEKIKIGEDCDYAVKVNKNKFLKFDMIHLTFKFDMRRFEQEGRIKILYIWSIANVRRFFIGEITKDEIPYEFGHHSRKP